MTGFGLAVGLGVVLAERRARRRPADAGDRRRRRHGLGGVPHEHAPERRRRLRPRPAPGHLHRRRRGWPPHRGRGARGERRDGGHGGGRGRRRRPGRDRDHGRGDRRAVVHSLPDHSEGHLPSPGDRPRRPRRHRARAQPAARAARRPPGHPDGEARRVAHVQGAQGRAAHPQARGGAGARPRDHRGDRDRVADAHRRRDPRHPARLVRAGRLRGRAAQPAGLLHLQERLHPRRRVLPLPLSQLRRDVARQARPGHRPDRAPGAAHRRARQDRHVHRPAPPARRRAHHDHDALPARRRTPLLGAGGQRRLDRPAQDRGHRPARSHPGDLARRRGRGRRTPRHPDQQRVPDGPSYAGLLRAPRRGRARAAAHRLALPEIVSFDRISDAHPAAIAGTLQRHAVAHHETPAHTPPRSPRSHSRPAAPAWRRTSPAPPSTPAGCCPTCRPRTRGRRPSTRSTRSSCSRSSSATRPRRSC